MYFVAIGLTSLSFAMYLAMMALFARAIVSRRARRRASRPRDSAGRAPAPRVSILKPLAGADDDLDQNLESFARIAYPSFEILFGVATRSDPAHRAARAFAARHPEIDVQVVLTEPAAALNPKVAQLIGLERRASGEVYVISDSNVRVGPDYLWSMVEDLADAGVGVVTSLFSGVGERSLGAALENLQICASTAPGYAAMDAVGRAFETARGAPPPALRPITVGKSMAVRRRDLAKIDGFAAVGGVLAEDHVLGARLMDAGLRARLSSEVVENRNVMCSMRSTLERHTRWAKTRCSLFPFAFAVEPMLTPVLVATLALAIAPNKVTAALLLFACVLQTLGALGAVRLLRAAALPWYGALLEVPRSYFAVVCWARACMSRRITWRGHAFVVLRGSAIAPLASSSTTPGDHSGARAAA